MQIFAFVKKSYCSVLTRLAAFPQTCKGLLLSTFFLDCSVTWYFVCVCVRNNSCAVWIYVAKITIKSTGSCIIKWCSHANILFLLNAGNNYSWNINKLFFSFRKDFLELPLFEFYGLTNGSYLVYCCSIIFVRFAVEIMTTSFINVPFELGELR